MWTAAYTRLCFVPDEVVVLVVAPVVRVVPVVVRRWVVVVVVVEVEVSECSARILSKKWQCYW